MTKSSDYSEQQLLCIASDPHEELASALAKKKISLFQKILFDNNANPELADEKVQISIFEKCCQTPGCADFIRACLAWGCDVHKVNETYNKTAINFGVESEDPGNVAALLEDPTINLDSLYSNQTPLNLLSANIKPDNYQNVFDCIKILVDRQANVNIPNQRGITPILAIVNNKNISDGQKEPIIEYMLANATVDLDSQRKGEARTKLTDKFPYVQLPDKRYTEKEWNFEHLKTALNDQLEQDFIDGFEKSDKQFDTGALLTVAAQRGLVRAVEKLLRCGADVNNDHDTKRTTEISDFPLGVACVYGNWKVIKQLLKCPTVDVRRAPLLTRVLKNMGEESLDITKCDYNKCFDLLLNHRAIDIHQKDECGNTALHTAVKYNNKTAILALLQRGAYMGTQNKFNDFSIADIDPKLLELHFDKCITTNNCRSGDDNYEIQFDFSNLVPAACRQDPEQPKGKARAKHCDEMATIEFMAKSSELRHLVKHPLIASFLFLKWHRLSLVFYTNFVCYSMYCMAIIAYLLFCFGQDTSSRGLAAFLYTVTAVGGLYVFAREMSQLVMSPKVYLRNKENYLEIALVVMTVVVLVPQNFIESTRRTVAAFTILLAVCEFFLLTGSLPFLSFSTHLVMLKTVSKSFLRGLLLYSIILIAFALCFYTLLGEDEIAKTTADTAEDDDEFNRFGHPGISIIKTVVMLTGEFDASSINFKQNISSYFVFVVFVFLISTVLFNLLNGLAVSDTQAIKNEAELTHFIYRAELMARYEKVMLGKGESECCNFIVRNCLSNWMCLFPEFLPLNIITVQPNKSNQVMIPARCVDAERKKSQHTYDIESGKVAPTTSVRDLECEIRMLGCCVGNQCSRMESKIVKYARAVLEKNEYGRDDEIDLHAINDRIVKIENNINQIFAKIDLVLAKLVPQNELDS